MQEYQSSTKFEKVPVSVPPSSIHTFLKNNANFPGLIMADHNTSYTNNFYNSLYDNASNIHYVYKNVPDNDENAFPSGTPQYFIASVAEIVGKAIYEQVTGLKYNSSKTVSKILVCNNIEVQDEK